MCRASAAKQPFFFGVLTLCALMLGWKRWSAQKKQQKKANGAEDNAAATEIERDK